ncbi:hypothetical protein GCM10027059_33830 [Myceligenerans halotolerans]
MAGPVATIARYADPVLIIGVLLSVGLSIVLDLTDATTTGESILIGLVGTTLTTVVDTTVRAERRFRWRALAERDAAADLQVERLLERAAHVVVEHPGTLVEREVAARFGALAADLVQMGEGRVLTARSDAGALLDRTRAARREIVAVTNIHTPDPHDSAWWSDTVGEQYWRANLDALERGVEVTRIFVYSAMTDELRALIAQHREAGVQVGVVHRGRIAPGLAMNLVLWDRKAGWEARTNAHGDVVGNCFTINTGDLDRLRRTFDECRRTADFATRMTEEPAAGAPSSDLP